MPSPMKKHVCTGMKVTKLATFTKTRSVPREKHHWIFFRDGKRVVAVYPIDFQVDRMVVKK